MDTKKLLTVIRRIERLESQLFALKNEARHIVAGHAAAPPVQKKRKMSAAAKQRISLAMKARWAGVKKKS